MKLSHLPILNRLSPDCDCNTSQSACLQWQPSRCSQATLTHTITMPVLCVQQGGTCQETSDCHNRQAMSRSKSLPLSAHVVLARSLQSSSSGLAGFSSSTLLQVCYPPLTPTPPPTPQTWAVMCASSVLHTVLGYLTQTELPPCSC